MRRDRRASGNGLRSALIVPLWVVAVHLSPLTCHLIAEAAVTKGDNQQIDTATTNQGGATRGSTTYNVQDAIGSPTETVRIKSSQFQIIPGFVGAVATSTIVPVSDLDLTVLEAKTESFGLTIAPKTWQTDNDPVFLWEPPEAPDVAGYSTAVDGVPDDEVDTTFTSFSVADGDPGTWSDGSHSFSVKAINTAGLSGNAISMELWVDTTPPTIVSRAPEGGGLFNAIPDVTATVSDASSGVDASSVAVYVNGSAASVTFDAETGMATATGGGWREGSNSIELRVTDVLGNAQTPQVWSLTLDTVPPTGTVTINGGAEMTTSVYVTLTFTASDKTSEVTALQISNDSLTGFVSEPYTALRPLWKLHAVRGEQTVYAKFTDSAGNVSTAISDSIDLALLAPETVITSGPAGFAPSQSVTFAFMCPEGGCLFSYAFDNDGWSEWDAATTATTEGLPFGNHYFRVKAARDLNGTEGLQLDEEDPTPAERTWIVGVEPSLFTIPMGPPIKMWRLD